MVAPHQVRDMLIRQHAVYQLRFNFVIHDGDLLNSIHIHLQLPNVPPQWRRASDAEYVN